VVQQSNTFEKLRKKFSIDHPEIENSTADKFKLFRKCVLLFLLIKFGGSIIITVFKFLRFEGLSIVLENQIRLADQFSLTVSLLLVILIMPAVEELAFRGWFSRSVFLVIISLTLFSYYFLNVAFKLIPILAETDKLLKLAILIFLSTLIGLFLFKHKDRTVQVISRNRSFLILLSVLSFSLIHAFNYSIKMITTESLFGLFLILLPFPFLAYVQTYLRIKNGLVWSFALHVLNNSLILFPVFFGHTKL
jgi:membrane protease YdiL (CAAX protease family)